MTNNKIIPIILAIFPIFFWEYLPIVNPVYVNEKLHKANVKAAIK